MAETYETLYWFGKIFRKKVTFNAASKPGVVFLWGYGNKMT
jgi:hypothetical protein